MSVDSNPGDLLIVGMLGIMLELLRPGLLGMMLGMMELLGMMLGSLIMIGRIAEMSDSAFGGLANGSAHARPSAGPPIDTKGNFPVSVSAESPSKISPNPSEVISEVSKPAGQLFKIPPFVLPKYSMVRGVVGLIK